MSVKPIPTANSTKKKQKQLLNSLVKVRYQISNPQPIKFELGGEQFEFVDSEISQSLVTVIQEAAQVLAKNPKAKLHVKASQSDNPLTAQEAANIIGMSRPMVVKAIKTGDLPYFMVGKHYRIQENDALAFKARLRQQTKHALEEMADLDNELGIE
ncbi:helix-turn-helix domain-containing protein [Endozoicomonas sp. SM1973]|uniref:Helix-turn-helix domain-containing protein n=1 Tax=Spartinivicinus marinus TaxID=2994442 RepID=A0A853I012_9GAMM|nr:helix-turn-helix domain-containing protein [Spartinivicinus marinus]MCX4026344.1 helix-turn-helix domain-containing protein [Spartinivicinus marinus]NYZ67310.1 helix-turn-helix domain-containing protein [Spartinivicinus marinus]